MVWPSGCHKCFPHLSVEWWTLNDLWPSNSCFPKVIVDVFPPWRCVGQWYIKKRMFCCLSRVEAFMLIVEEYGPGVFVCRALRKGMFWYKLKHTVKLTDKNKEEHEVQLQVCCLMNIMSHVGQQGALWPKAARSVSRTDIQAWMSPGCAGCCVRSSWRIRWATCALLLPVSWTILGPESL